MQKTIIEERYSYTYHTKKQYYVLEGASFTVK